MNLDGSSWKPPYVPCLIQFHLVYSFVFNAFIIHLFIAAHHLTQWHTTNVSSSRNQSIHVDQMLQKIPTKYIVNSIVKIQSNPFCCWPAYCKVAGKKNSSITDSALAGQTLKKWEEEEEEEKEEECVGRSVPFFLSLALLDVCTRPSETYPSIGVAPDPRECSGGDGGLLLLLALLVLLPA